ncbi:MAG TPA: sigma-70 family RNA polymerase sigma factor [Thermoanaerobaculia bacterium]|nr:sigma-70 family RNA polymerase sigma factor [Thermoanaerobaculia bacterium]
MPHAEVSTPLADEPGTQPLAGLMSWDHLVHDHGRHLTGAVARAMRQCGWPPQRDDVDELVQETYCRLLASPEGRAGGLRRREPAQLRAYLNRVAASVVTDHLRSRLAVKRGAGRVVSAQSLARPVLEQRADGSPTAEESLLRQAGRRALLERLRGRLRGRRAGRDLRVLELAVVEELTAAEICERLGGALAPTTIPTLLHRLRQELAVGGSCGVVCW